MNKIIVSLILLISIISAPIATVSAAYSPFGGVCTQPEAKSSAVCNEKRTGNPISGPDGILIKITHLVAFVAGLAAVIVIVVAGIRMITSSGDSNSVGSARKAVLSALIGLVIIVFAQGIIVYIVDRVK